MGVVKKADARMEAILRPRFHNVTCRTMIFKQIPNLFLFLFKLFIVFFEIENVTYRGGVVILFELHPDDAHQNTGGWC